MPTYELYSYFRSSCSARVRIAAHLKSIPLKYHFIHLVKGEQRSDSYKQINPSASVPTLIINLDDGTSSSIKQSVAILEYFEETHPENPLLPPLSDSIGRARVRELVNIVSDDIQPVTNLRILQRVRGMPEGSAEEWARHFMQLGLQSYEALASSYSGRYSVGDTVTLADVCLTPAVDGAMRFGVDFEKLPNVKRIYDELQKVEAFQKGGWRSQEDTPDEFRPPSTKL